MNTEINLTQILDQIGPRIGEDAAWLDATDGFIGANYDTLREERVFSALIPTVYGGGGATHAEMCEFVRGLGSLCPSTALTLSMHQHLVGAAVANDRAGRPGRALLDKVAGSELILVSTGANDWLESNGTAKRVTGGFEITAVKPFASGSPAGDVIVTSAAYDDPVEGPQVLHFPIPLKSEGITLMGDWQTMGMRATGSQTVKFDNVFVPEAAVALRRPRGGFHPAYSVILTVAMPLITSAYLGAAEAAAVIARERARKRQDDPLTPVLLGEMETLLTTAQIARDDMVRLANGFDFEPTAELASQVLTRKTICAKHVIAVGEKALEATGGSGFFRKLGLERFLRDLHGAQFHPLSEKRQQLFTGRLAMGLEPVESKQEQSFKAAA
jgi:alkylation response protein AidB-like acyl-CoA dehydrogenase